MVGGESSLDIMNSVVTMNVFKNLNTGYQFLDMMLSSLIMMYIGNIFVNIEKYLKKIKSYLTYFTYNKVTIEGYHSLVVGNWHTRSHNIFSVRFRALWHYIQSIQSEENNITSLKEYPTNSRSDDDDDNVNDKTKKDIFIVNQKKSFEIEKDIWCKVNFLEEDIENKRNSDDSRSSKLEKISIDIYSKKYSAVYLKDFLNSISEKYIQDLFMERKNKLFIYSLSGFTSNAEYDGSSSVSWDECEFTSSRNFDTIFFEKKDELISKIDFFRDNEEWYKKEGHPYTLGIALHGPPGTGKTSVIKSIANYLRRSLIIIPLSKIKTQRDFHKCFFDSEYNHKNAKHGIPFNKKIIVFEDIDCMSDIILERKQKKENASKEITKEELLNTIKSGISKSSSNEEFVSTINSKNSSDDLTLSYILNIIDGIRETPGRIMIITSNHYNKLDKAFTRPGRIDVSLEMQNASVETIQNIVRHYYNEEIPENILEKMKDNVVSPAALINLRFKAKTMKEYLDMLLSMFTEI